MKFSLEQKQLFDVFSLLKGVSDKRQVSAILGNALVKASGDTITFLATSVEVGIQVKTKGIVEEEGVATIPVRSFHDIIKEMPDSVININLKDTSLKIQSGKINFEIPTLPPSDFPEIDIPEKVGGKTLNSKDVKYLFEKTSFCASSDETRYYLNSIYFDKSPNNGIRFVATNARELAIAESNIVSLSEISDGRSFLMPRRAFSEFSKLLSKYEKINIWVKKPNIYISDNNGDTILFVKEIQKDFPDYESVIPKENDVIFKVNKELILSSIKRVSIVSDEDLKTVVLSGSGNILHLSAESSRLGKAEEEIEIQNMGKDLTSTKFNARYLLDIISACDSEMIVFETTEEFGPFIIKPEKDSENLIYVLMPIEV